MGFQDKIQDWAVTEISEAKRARVALGLVFVLGGVVGWNVNSFFYAERFAVMEQRLLSRQEEGTHETTTDSANRTSVIQRWGGGGIKNCFVSVNGAELSQFTREYNAVLMCGIGRADTDRITDPAISISKAFSIEPAFAVEMPVSTQMQSAILEVAKTLVRPPSLPRGTPAAARLSLWYEIALLPKGLDHASVVHTLADVDRFGGKRLPGEAKGTSITWPIPQ